MLVLWQTTDISYTKICSKKIMFRVIFVYSKVYAVKGFTRLLYDTVNLLFIMTPRFSDKPR